MNISADCLVVGAGIIGMLTARELADAGLDVVLIDQGNGGGESSWAGGGILSPLYPWRYPDTVNRLAQWSQKQYPALAQSLLDETGIDPEFVDNGLLVLETAEQEIAAVWASHFGVTWRAVNDAACLDLEPALGRVVPSLWFPAIGQVRNPRLVKALRASLEQRGIRFFGQCRMTGLRKAGNRVRAVETPLGTITTGNVVIASGAWSGELLAMAGLELPVEPVRGQMILFRGPAGGVRRILLSEGRYLIPRRDGRVLAGSTLEHVGFDKSTTQEALASLRDSALKLMPSLADYTIEHHWAGLRPGSPEGVPFIGAHPAISNLFVNAGHYRNGVVLGPASARLCADIVLTRQPVIEPAPYKPA